MTVHIDEALARLSAGAEHPGLDGLEDRVFSAIGRESTRMAGTRVTMSAAAFALALGAVSNVVPTADAEAPAIISPFGASSPLAPSTLLIGR
jgi:enoyl-CoA hydratase/carnithine racemase